MGADDKGALTPHVEGALTLHVEGAVKKYQGKATTQRLVAILIDATKERKLVWFRDASWYAVTFMPMLAVSFRLKLVQPMNDPSLSLPARMAQIDGYAFNERVALVVVGRHGQ